MIQSRAFAVIFAVLASAACAAPVPSTKEGVAPDWNTLSERDLFTIVTKTPASEARDTTIWLVVFEGQPYIRSGDAMRGGGESWVDDLARDPVASLRAGKMNLPVRVIPVEDAVRVERVQEAFAEKYGFLNSIIRWARPSLTRISRLEPIPRNSEKSPPAR